MRIGAHVDPPTRSPRRPPARPTRCSSSSPTRRATSRPSRAPTRTALRASDVDVYIHAPYRINVATLNNRIRIPSRKLLMAHADGRGRARREGPDRARRPRRQGRRPRQPASTTGARRSSTRRSDGGFATAGPDREHRRRRQRLRPPVRRAGPAVGRGRRVRRRLLPGHLPRPRRRRGPARHRRPGQGDHRPDRPDPRQRLARTPFDSGRDRHDNLGNGKIDPELVVAVVRAAGAPVVVETPGGVEGQAADIAFLRDRVGR